MLRKSGKPQRDPCSPPSRLRMVRLSVNWDGRTDGVKEQQLGFSDWERSAVRKQTRKEKFLCKMEAVLPFSTLVKVM